MTEAVTKQRRLLAPRITEVSGVDRPAHLRDGWIIKKAVGTEGTQALLDALGRGARMPKTIEAASATSLLKSLTGEQRALLVEDGGTAKLAKALTPEQTTEFVKAADASDLQPLLDQLAAVWSGLRDLSEKEDPDVPSTEIDPATGVAPVAPVAPDATAVLASPALAKALGAEGVAMLKAMHEQGEAAREELRKEREARLDDASVAEFEKSFGSLGLDAPALAPALRKFALAEPAAAVLVREALTKAHTTQTSTQSVLLKEIGRVASPKGDTPLGQIESIAKGLIGSNGINTIEQARVAAYAQRPDLYDAARNAGGE